MRLYKVSSPEKVWQIVRENFTSLPAERVDLEEAGGRVNAADLFAPEDVPGFDRSTVDGYAVRAADTFGACETIPAMLQLTGEVNMGQAAPSLAQGGCVYVPTGGMLPHGADAVVMIEHTGLIGDIVNCYRQVAPGDNVIRQGEDVRKDSLVLEKGRLLRAPEIGLLASLGIAQLEVTRKPLIGILSTGDEIVPYKTKCVRTGQVRDSNALGLGEIARKKGADVWYGGIISDVLADFRQGVESLLKLVDFLVLSGGSSVGARDFTAMTLKEIAEGDLLVEGIAVQPGKPTLLAKCGGKPVLGLPGHPVSALNIFNLFGTSIIRRLLGQREQEFQPVVRAVLMRNLPSQIGRTDYVRVRLEKRDGKVEAVPVFGRSGLLRTLADADGIVRIPAGCEGIPAGEIIEVILMD